MTDDITLRILDDPEAAQVIDLARQLHAIPRGEGGARIIAQGARLIADARPDAAGWVRISGAAIQFWAEAARHRPRLAANERAARHALAGAGVRFRE